MSLVKCEECGKEISNDAKACPNCGKPHTPKAPPMPKGMKIGCAAIVGVALVIAGISDCHHNATKTPEEARAEKIEKLFSPWDGSIQNLEKVIKASMNDPDSYKHDKTVYWDRGDHLIVRTTFQGKNAFGGVVTNWVEAKVDLDGKILEITQTSQDLQELDTEYP